MCVSVCVWLCVSFQDVVVVLQALLDRHAMLRLRVGQDENEAGAGGWSLAVPEPEDESAAASDPAFRSERGAGRPVETP